MNAYYNELEAYCVKWLENLVLDEQISAGKIDGRDIHDVEAIDLEKYTQCHFFAGIGGWSVALRLVGWPDTVPVWTGSCPCQPFSQAGARKGFADKRHLWPAWFWLIDACRPPVIFGEQVASKAGLAWLDLVLSDLEGAGYAVRAADICAAGVGAPHIRQRLWFAAWLEDTVGRGGQRWDVPGSDESAKKDEERARHLSEGSGSDCGLVHANGNGCQERRAAAKTVGQRRSAYSTGWDDHDWIQCADGKIRPIEPGIRPVAYGIPNPASILRAYGNAIVPHVAATFIQAVMEEIGINALVREKHDT